MILNIQSFEDGVQLITPFRTFSWKNIIYYWAAPYRFQQAARCPGRRSTSGGSSLRQRSDSQGQRD